MENNSQVVIVRNESQAVPAIAAFLFGGIGQLIQGRILAGLLWIGIEWLVCLPMLLVSIIFIVGPILTGPLWFLTRILCVIDAAIYKPDSGKKLGGILKFIIWVNVIIFLLVIIAAVAIGTSAPPVRFVP